MLYGWKIALACSSPGRNFLESVTTRSTYSLFLKTINPAIAPQCRLGSSIRNSLLNKSLLSLDESFMLIIKGVPILPVPAEVFGNLVFIVNCHLGPSSLAHGE